MVQGAEAALTALARRFGQDLMAKLPCLSAHATESLRPEGYAMGGSLAPPTADAQVCCIADCLPLWMRIVSSFLLPGYSVIHPTPILLSMEVQYKHAAYGQDNHHGPDSLWDVKLSRWSASVTNQPKCPSSLCKCWRRFEPLLLCRPSSMRCRS